MASLSFSTWSSARLASSCIATCHCSPVRQARTCLLRESWRTWAVQWFAPKVGCDRHLWMVGTCWYLDYGQHMNSNQNQAWPAFLLRTCRRIVNNEIGLQRSNSSIFQERQHLSRAGCRKMSCNFCFMISFDIKFSTLERFHAASFRSSSFETARLKGTTSRRWGARGSLLQKAWSFLWGSHPTSLLGYAAGLLPSPLLTGTDALAVADEICGPVGSSGFCNPWAVSSSGCSMLSWEHPKASAIATHERSPKWWFIALVNDSSMVNIISKPLTTSH